MFCFPQQAIHSCFQQWATYLLGSFQPTEEEEIKHFIPGKFLTSEGLELIASIRKRDWEKLRVREDFEENGKFYWRLYFCTTPGGNLTKIHLIKPLINPPLLVSPSGETFDLRFRTSKKYNHLKRKSQ